MNGAMCVFCGKDRKLSKEHVWAQWLRSYPHFEALLRAQGADGQRFKQDETILRLNEQGVWVEDVAFTRHIAKLLPFVKVPVCRECNNGWMSQMELRAQSILHPMIMGESVQITEEEQTELAAWVAKTSFAYTSTWAPSNRPFVSEDYQTLSRSQRAPPG